MDNTNDAMINTTHISATLKAKVRTGQTQGACSATPQQHAYTVPKGYKLVKDEPNVCQPAPVEQTAPISITFHYERTQAKAIGALGQQTGNGSPVIMVIEGLAGGTVQLEMHRTQLSAIVGRIDAARKAIG